MRILPLALALLLCACGGKSDDPVVLLQQERDPNLRQAALLALLDRGPGERALWRRLLGDEDPEIARMAAAALRQASARAEWAKVPDDLAEALLEAAARKEPEVRVEALLSLSAVRADDPTFPSRIAGALADPDARVRRAAVEAFRTFGPSTGGLDLGALRRILLGEPALSLDAALALAACGDGAPETLDRLAAAAEDGKDPAAGLRAARALAVLGPRASGAATRLAPRLAGSPELLARDLADALGQFGLPDPAVVAALEKALDRREEPVRVCAALSLLRLGKPSAKGPALLAAGLRARDPLARLRAAEGLAHLGPGGWDLLRAETASGGAEAALALARLASAGRRLPPEALATLEEAAKSPSLDLRRAALRALAAANAR